ncbi:MAG TPA: DUF6325 family protein [Candidatus Nanopelagicales bacterium]|nr:DUF6325 family protein [Candidatus Nanopelagicales bacterium]
MAEQVVAPVGPVDVVVVGFGENRFDGSIIPAIADLVARGLVRILDLLVVSKDDDGQVTILQVADLDGDGINDLAILTGDIEGLLAEDDAAAVAEGLPPGSTAAMLAWENTWAIETAVAIRRAGGEVLAHERIPAPDVQAVLEALAAQD